MDQVWEGAVVPDAAFGIPSRAVAAICLVDHGFLYRVWGGVVDVEVDADVDVDVEADREEVRTEVCGTCNSLSSALTSRLARFADMTVVGLGGWLGLPMAIVEVIGLGAMMRL